MSNYCTSCGNKIKEGSKFCQNCGAQVQKIESLSIFEEQVAQTYNHQAPTQAILSHIPQHKQQMGQTQTYSPTPQKKSNTKLIAGLVVSIVAIVVVLLVIFLFFGGFLGGTSGADFEGSWEVISTTMDGVSQGGSSNYVTFQSDGKFITSGSKDTWEIRDNKIFIYIRSENGQFDGIGFNYQFSNNNNRLVLSYTGYDSYGEFHIMSILLTKANGGTNE